MPPFEYSAPSSRYSGTIADLLLRRGDITARGAESVGQAQARAAELTGQAQAQAAQRSGLAWAGAAQQVGQIPAQMQQARAQQLDNSARAQHLQAGALDVEARQRASAATKTLSTVMQQTPKLSEDGVSVWDVPAITRTLADQGFGPEAGVAAQHLDGINNAFRQTRAAQLGVVQRGAQAVAAAGNDPELAKHFLDQVDANGIYPKDTIQQFREFIDADPGNVKKLTAYLMGPQKAEIVPADARAINPVTNEVMVPAEAKPGEGQHVINGQLVGPDGQPIGAPIPKEVDPADLALKQAQLKEINAKLDGSMPMSAKDQAELRMQQARLSAEVSHWKTQDAANEAAPTLTGDALNLTAHQYAMTGQLPPMGMGKQGAAVRTAIINKAADIYKNLDLPSQVAAYKANQASLVHTQGTLDNLTAFEKAAGKNIDMFVTLTKNLPDTGSPWMNTPLRLLSDKMAGNQYLPAINAARQIAAREVARVVNDPGLKGQLTDNARQGVDAMVSGDITLKQMKEVLPVLQQDMANVHSSLSDQLKDIQTRIATPPGGTTSGTPQQQPIPGIPGGVAEFRDGKWIRVK